MEPSVASSKFDAIVIGAGMSGMACAIRLGMFEQKVALLEKHSVPGGLNSYFQRVKKDENGKRTGIRKFDVGLHALTNFVRKGRKGTPLPKILKQLRISYDTWQMKEQSFSKVMFPGKELIFSNDFQTLEADIKKKFASDYDGFMKLHHFILEFDDNRIDYPFLGARAKIKEFINNPLLVEMILCPLMFYGSSWENDIDLLQFVILYKSIYLEGFARPLGGVRTLITPLVERLEKNNIDCKFKTVVKKVLLDESKKVCGVELESGEKLFADKVYSSIGLPETDKLLEREQSEKGNLSFVECMFVYDRKVDKLVNKSTITFFNKEKEFRYRNPEESVDFQSGVFCIPDNYEEHESEEGMVRITYLANHKKWMQFSDDEYQEEKKIVQKKSLDLIKEMCPGDNRKLRYVDIFTPRTIKKYTQHENGCVYGAPHKKRSGESGIDNLFLIGTDQGYLGIIGSLLSGISIANKFGLSERLP